ncbi:hypothetical protein [Laspinema olomoucense]|uniref:hypothetical protein n=1 Tax=Laspinema olomoucense TaxID=3231600 RepID=UPI0021BAC931|nr:hypothetical protein [Laspinema sp. D3d]MCT7971205.1 hypothetical protein [Laspinema sp. D3d]
MSEVTEFVLKVSAKFRDTVLSLEDYDYDMTEEIWSKFSTAEKTKLMEKWKLQLGEELDFSHATIQVKLVEQKKTIND